MMGAVALVLTLSVDMHGSNTVVSNSSIQGS